MALRRSCGMQNKGGPLPQRRVTHQVLATTAVMGAVLAVFLVLWLFAVPGDKEVRSIATPPNEAAQGKR